MEGDLDMFAPLPIKAPLERLDLELGAEEFAPEHILQAKEIRDESAADVVMAIFGKMCPDKLHEMQGPLERVSVKTFIRYCTVISTLGSARGIEDPLGLPTPSRVASLLSVPLEVLKARLVIPRAPMLSILTDGTLADYVMKMRGVVVHPRETESDLDPLRYTVCEVEVPGCSTRLTISLNRMSHGRVIGGGHDFVEWHNTVHRSALGYFQTTAEARHVALFLMSKYNVQITKEGISFPSYPAERATPLKAFFITLSSPDLDSRVAPIVTQVVRYLKSPENRPPMPTSHKESKLYYLEYVLTKLFQAASASDFKHICEFVDVLGSNYTKKWGELLKTGFFTKGNAIDGEAIAQFARGELTVPGNIRVRVWGDLMGFVTQSRSEIRSHTDLPRKSDTPGLQGACGSHLSVPGKIQGALEVLRSMSGTQHFDKIDAYGTHVANHWHKEVVLALSQGGKVVWHDINKAYAPPLGGEFVVANVEMIPPGSGRGKYIFDDTFNAAESAAQDNVAAVNTSRKVKSIIDAGYEGGLVKMYLGTGQDKDQRLSEIPPGVRQFMDSYPSVWLSPGGSPHSPEYYLVFHVGNPTIPGWLPAPAPLVGELKNGCQSDPDPVSHRARRARVIQTWFAIRGYEIVRSNCILNIQVGCGYIDRGDVALRLNYPRVTRILCSGYKQVDVRVQDEDIVTHQEDASPFTMEF